jgi:hypothetical protein
MTSMMTAYRRSATNVCPRCGHRDDPASFYHSGDGLVCERCHRREKRDDRARHATSEGSVDALLNGLLGPACGLGSALFALLAPEGPMPSRAFVIFAFGLSAAAACVVRAFRFPNDLPRVRLWRATASAGGALAVIALVAFASR